MVRVVGTAIILVVLLAIFEIAAFVALGFVPQLASRTYSPPPVSRAQYDTFLTERDPHLGWPGPSWLADMTDEQGARLSPANQALKNRPACASLFGDSFAFSDEVEAEHAWANVMAEQLNCRVLNFGVGGYGTDQALLRMQRKVAEGGELGGVTILSVYPDNLNRIANRWRYLLGGYALGFKPAFVRDGDGFRVQEPFSGSYEEFQAMAADPVGPMRGDQYLPGKSGFKRKIIGGFPYSWTLAKVLVSEISAIRQWFAPRPIFMNYPVYFDNKTGPSQEKRAAMLHILKEYEALCARTGRNCVLLLVPDPDVVFQVEQGGQHTLGWLLDAAGPETTTLDATEMFADVDDICLALTRPADCQGHFNADGYRRLAEFVAGGLRQAYPDVFPSALLD